jgi:hypothetical protein
MYRVSHKVHAPASAGAGVLGRNRRTCLLRASASSTRGQPWPTAGRQTSQPTPEELAKRSAAVQELLRESMRLAVETGALPAASVPSERPWRTLAFAPGDDAPTVPQIVDRFHIAHTARRAPRVFPQRAGCWSCRQPGAGSPAERCATGPTASAAS